MILDWNEVVDEDPYMERSKTKQDRFNKAISDITRAYLKDTFLPAVRNLVADVCEVFISPSAPDIVAVRYPISFKERYLRPEIQLEVGPLAAWIPNELYSISPYAGEAIPNVFQNSSVCIRAIVAERTFWEKATILHQEAHRPEGKPQPSRYSRHYYDLAMMAGSAVKAHALEDLALLHAVVEFKCKFYPSNWARYELARPGTFRLVPPEHVRRTLERDYREMRIMIFGEAPPFDRIISEMKGLEEEINSQAETTL